MELRLVYGLLVALALFAVVWFVFVVPSERRDHERRLAVVRKRLAERERRLAAATRERGEQDDDGGDRDGIDDESCAGNAAGDNSGDEPGDAQSDRQL